MKIYDCFIFFNENLLTEIRLNILNKHVDYFVICESPVKSSRARMFSGDSGIQIREPACPRMPECRCLLSRSGILKFPALEGRPPEPQTSRLSPSAPCHQRISALSWISFRPAAERNESQI